MTSDPPARRLGDFELFELLGRGGMGEVFRARLHGSDRWLALKLAAPESILSEALLTRFLREGEIAASLRHPHILTVHSAGVVETRPFLAFDLVEGCQTFMEFAESVPTRAALEALRDVSRALGHAHQRGVLHRDVKPDNVLIDRDGRALLADFGVALATDMERLTQTGMVVGTPLYMAPETITAGREGSSPRNDVYSMGVILYELLTGTHPFEDQGLAALASPRTRDVRPLRSLAPDVAPALESITLRALATDPRRRYANGDELADALDAWLEGRARRVPVPLVAGAAALLAVAAAWTWSRTPSQPLPSPQLDSLTPAPSPEDSPLAPPVTPHPTHALELERTELIEAALEFVRTEPLDLPALLLPLQRLAASRDLGATEKGSELANAALALQPGPELSWTQAAALWSAVARAGCSATNRERAETIVDEAYWSRRFYNHLDEASYQQVILALVDLDVDVEQDPVLALLPEDSDETADLDILPGSSPGESFLIARFRAQHNDADARASLRRLGFDARLGARTRSRALVEGQERLKRLSPGQFDEVAQELALAVELDPESPWAHQRHAQILWLQNRRGSSADQFERALQLWRAGRGRRRTISGYWRRSFLGPIVSRLIDAGRFESAQEAIDQIDREGTFETNAPNTKLKLWKRSHQERLEAARASAER